MTNLQLYLAINAFMIIAVCGLLMFVCSEFIKEEREGRKKI